MKCDDMDRTASVDFAMPSPRPRRQDALSKVRRDEQGAKTEDEPGGESTCMGNVDGMKAGTILHYKPAD